MPRPTLKYATELRKKSEDCISKSRAALSELHDILALSRFRFKTSVKHIRNSDLLIRDLVQQLPGTKVDR